MPVKVYTRSTCVPCRQLKVWLQRNKVEYEEMNVDEKPELIDEIIKKTGFMSVPVTVIGETIVAGPNFGKLKELLQTA